MSTPRRSYAEYLALEATSDLKHEWLRGEIWAMAGGTIEHARLQVNVASEIRAALRGRPCVVLSSDARVRIDATDRTTYPDVSVVCGKRETSPADEEAVINPTVLVEVLSDSSEKSDRGEKFAHYRHLASLEEYLLVSQDEQHLEVFRRGPEGWTLSEARAGETLELRSIGVTLAVDAVYDDPLG